MRNVIGRIAAVTGAVACSLGAVLAPAAADTSPGAGGVPATVSADALPTWQVNGVVWSSTVVGTTVFAVGSFTKARPPGTAAGDPHEVARGSILAFDIRSGDLLRGFAHTLNGPAYRVVSSPDGSRVYVGGDFTTVDGQPRARIAAFDVASGALTRSFHPALDHAVRALAVSRGGVVYAGGAFLRANGAARTRLAAFRASDGLLLPWAPSADDNTVFAMVMAPDQSRVIVGGRFTKVNRTTHVGVVSLRASNGAALAWSSRPVPAPVGRSFSYVTDLVTDGRLVYGADDGEGWHWFDGRWAADPYSGSLVWLDNCYGATYGLFVSRQVLYSVGHAHDCTSLGAWPETNPRTYHRALAETTYPTGRDPGPPSANSSYAHQPVPSLLHWFPTLAAGSYTGMSQAAWTVTGTAQYVVLGGEFPAVNGRPQQGLTRFAVASIAPDLAGPASSSALRPTAQVADDGTVTVTWTGTWDPDNGRLSYAVYRNDLADPVATVDAGSLPWSLPSLSVQDGPLDPGSTNTYRVVVTDAFGNRVGSTVSDPVGVPSDSGASGGGDPAAADPGTGTGAAGDPAGGGTP